MKLRITIFVEPLTDTSGSEPSPATSPSSIDRKRYGQPCSSVTRFLRELTEGEIGDFEIAPCLASDCYNLYRRWCGRAGLYSAPIKTFICTLRREHQIQSVRKRYTDAQEIRGPNAILFFGNQLSTLSAEELGDHIARFRSAFRAYDGIS